MTLSDIDTTRLHLRCWQQADAVALLPILHANVGHLEKWIPAHVYEPAPLAELEQRLQGFADDFHAGRNWRFGIFTQDGSAVLGEASLFPRSAEGRVNVDQADRVEIGYWLRRDVTGRGYATEASRALLSLASDMPRMCRVEIRCDPLNQPSAAVPARLGFVQTTPGVWIHELATEVGSR